MRASTGRSEGLGHVPSMGKSERIELLIAYKRGHGPELSAFISKP